MREKSDCSRERIAAECGGPVRMYGGVIREFLVVAGSPDGVVISAFSGV